MVPLATEFFRNSCLAMPSRISSETNSRASESGPVTISTVETVSEGIVARVVLTRGLLTLL
jgi:hypothetical protein